MTGILTRRASLHRKLSEEEKINSQLNEQIMQFKSLANIGMITAMVAHEMNNILTPLGNYAQLALANPDDSHLQQKALHKTILNSERATRILNALLNLANGSEQEKQPCKARELVNGVFDCLGRDFQKDCIELRIEIGEDMGIFCEPTGIQQVIMNLVLNAREAMLTGGGILTISARRSDDNYVWIDIADTGCGMDEEILDNIFSPFFTTKSRQDRKHHAGSGLGLTFCKQIIEAHDGILEVSSIKGSGSRFTFAIPDAE